MSFNFQPQIEEIHLSGELLQVTLQALSEPRPGHPGNHIRVAFFESRAYLKSALLLLASAERVLAEVSEGDIHGQ